MDYGGCYVTSTGRAVPFTHTTLTHDKSAVSHIFRELYATGAAMLQLLQTMPRILSLSRTAQRPFLRRDLPHPS